MATKSDSNIDASRKGDVNVNILGTCGAWHSDKTALYRQEIYRERLARHSDQDRTFRYLDNDCYVFFVFDGHGTDHCIDIVMKYIENASPEELKSIDFLSKTTPKSIQKG